MRAFAAVCLVLLGVSLCAAQGSLATPMITLGITLPQVNHPASIQVVVSNPTFSPVPTGSVIVNFGDGSPAVNLPLSTTSAQTTHTYTTLGTFSITATYSGDANFASANATLTTVSVNSAPTYLLSEFGDSLTGGTPTSWPVLLVAALGWTNHSYGCGGCKTNDQAPYIYAMSVDTTSASTWLLGQNDSPQTQADEDQFRAAALAQNAWLAIPEGPAKLHAQGSGVTQSGTWAASDVYSAIGLRSTAAGSTLTATLPGSTLYLGLTSLPTTDYTVDIVIDGVDQGAVSPVSSYVGKNETAETFGLRYALGGARSASHTVEVVCTNPGTSGCYVDWIGSNSAAARPNQPPYLWTGVTYRTPQPDPNNTVDVRSAIVRDVESALESDGLAIRVADIASVFSGVALPECVADGVHPNDCGNLIEEAVWLSSMSYLATEAQRIDVSPLPQLTVGTPTALSVAAATSRLPITYTVVSGPATIAGSSITATQAGTIVMQASQAGNNMALPAAPVQFSLHALAPTSTSLSASGSDLLLGANVTLSATVTSGGTPVSQGAVTFLDGNTSLATVAVNGSGVATYTAAPTAGVHPYTASYTGTTLLEPSSSPTVSVTVTQPDFALSVTPNSLIALRGGSSTATVTLTPSGGFNSTVSFACSGLPSGVACSFGAAAAQGNGTSTYALTISAAKNAGAARGGLGVAWTALPLTLLFLYRTRRRGLRVLLAVVVAALALAGASGCTSKANGPVTANVTITGQAASGQIHTVPLALTVR